MQHFIGKIDISNFLKSREQFEKYRQNLLSEQERSGAIQAFEFTYEAAWKTMKKFLAYQGIIELNTPRQCFREAAKFGLISETAAWFHFIDIRNLTVHTYSEQNAKKVVDSFDKFAMALADFMSNLEKIKSFILIQMIIILLIISSKNTHIVFMYTVPDLRGCNKDSLT